MSFNYQKIGLYIFLSELVVLTTGLLFGQLFITNINDYLGIVTFVYSLVFVVYFCGSIFFKISVGSFSWLTYGVLAAVGLSTVASLVVNKQILSQFFGFGFGIETGVAMFIFLVHIFFARYLFLYFDKLIVWSYYFVGFFALLLIPSVFLNLLDTEQSALYLMLTASAVYFAHQIDEVGLESKIKYSLMCFLFLVLIFTLLILDVSLVSALVALSLLCLWISKVVNSKNDGARFYKIATLILAIILCFNVVVSFAEHDVKTDYSLLEKTWLISYLNVVYSNQSNMDIIFGAGPNSISYQWSDRKGYKLRFKSLWDSEGNDLGGFIPTSVASTGIFGAVSWFLFISFALICCVKSFKAVSCDFNQHIIIPIVMVCSLLFLSSNYLIFVGAALILGVLFAAQSGNETRLKNVKYSLLTSIIFVLVCIVCVSGVVYSYNTARALYFYEGAHSSYLEGDIQNAEVLFRQSISIRPHSQSLRSYAQFLRQRLITGLEEGDITGLEIQKISSDALIHANEAAFVDPQEYKNWMVLGNIYFTLAQLGVKDSTQLAERAYSNAGRQVRKQPEIYYMKAQLYIFDKDYQNALESIDVALRIHPYYQQAINLRQIILEGQENEGS